MSSSKNPKPQLTSYYEHSAVNGLLLGTDAEGRCFTGGFIPKAPEKPLKPNMRYIRKMRERVQAENPHFEQWEVAGTVANMWRELPAAEKQVYQRHYESDKARWDAEMKVYRSSRPYQEHLRAQEESGVYGRQLKMESEYYESDYRGDEKRALKRTFDPDKELRRCGEELVEVPKSKDEDALDNIDAVGEAAARFQLNHELMQQMLGATVVPEGENICTEDRHSSLRRRSEDLKQRQQKLDEELVEMERKHALKKRKWAEQTERFNKSMESLRYVDYSKNVTSEECSEAAGSKKVKISSNADDQNVLQKENAIEKNEADATASKSVTKQTGSN